MRKDILSQLSIDVLNDSALSWGAKGLYLYMAHGFLPEAEVSRAKLIESSSTGRYATISALRELIQAKLVQKIVKRKSDKRFDGHYYKVR